MSLRSFLSTSKLNGCSKWKTQTLIILSQILIFALNLINVLLNNGNATVDLDQSLFEETDEEVDVLCQ